MITIVGAGLVGSLWAILLRKKGYEVQLFERRPDPRNEKGAAGRSINLIVTSRGWNALEKAGLREAVQPLAVTVYGRMIHSRAGEQTYQAYGQASECNYSISRAGLNKFLLSEAEKLGAKVYFDHELEGLDPAKKQIHFKTFRGPQSYEYQILFGADGAGSRLRKELARLHPEKFNQHTEWLEADYKELSLPLNSKGQPQLKTDALHIWPRGSYMLMGLANLDGSFTMTLYLPKTRIGNSPWSFDQLNDKAQVQKLFEQEFPDALQLMPEAVNEFIENPQGALGTVHSSKWVFSHSIALMGDAAHAIVPFFGQGMNSGFEDCSTLLALLEEHPQDWTTILQKYEAQQKPNAIAIAEMALENWVEMRDKVADPKFQLQKKLESMLEQKYPGKYKSRYGMITYTLVPYAEAQAKGEKQSALLQKILAGKSTIEEVDWKQVDELVKML